MISGATLCARVEVTIVVRSERAFTLQKLAQQESQRSLDEIDSLVES